MRIRLREPEIAFLFLLPAFIGVIVFYYYQIVQTGIYSLYNLQYTADWRQQPFVWLRNYWVVFHSTYFWQSMYFTLYFTIMATGLELCVGLAMAMATFWVPRGLGGILRAIIVMPWVIPPIINAMIWRWLFHPDVGLFGYVLTRMGIVSKPPLFLTDPLLAMHSLIFADVWKNASIMAIFLLGGLAAIPQDVYDAAKVDGARAWFRFWRVTLPLLLPTILVALLFRGIDALRTFDLVYGLTGGGPGTATETLSSFAYKYYFTYGKFGLGSAYAIVVFAIIIGLALFYLSRIRQNLRFKE
ncbi:MAG: sugar ABC transporter permease [Chloroflexi bacterium]|nr:sugar ABC transporter permease [Chloroflexota bacterium]MCL5075938.1 sugar ABC transporter permease [Chloroflexota bacterium]